jgi:hypothetical protein
MSERTAPPKTEGCLPRKSFQGKSDSRYLAHLLEDVHNQQLLLLRPPLNSSLLPHYPSHSSIPHSTLIHTSPLDYSLFCHYPQLFVLQSPLLNQFPRSPSSTHEFNRPAYRRAGSTSFELCSRGSRSLSDNPGSQGIGVVRAIQQDTKQRSAVRTVEHDPFPTPTPQLSTVSSQST